MACRALQLLRIAAMAPKSPQRGTAWARLCKERTLNASLALLRDAVRRGRVNSEDVQTMTLTAAGSERLQAGTLLERRG